MCKIVNWNWEDVELIVVIKYVFIKWVVEVVDVGILYFGENRDEGFLEKYELIGEKVIWYFIGSL